VSARRSLAWALATALLVGVGVATLWSPLWRAGPREAVLIPAPLDPQSPSRAVAQANQRLDVTFAAWLVARNARTLVSSPHRLMDTEHCAPAAKSIAFGPPMLTLGALGVPAWLLTGDPVLTYNVAALLVPLIGALALFLLVSDWTGVAPAGAMAGLLYGLGAAALGDVSHPFIRDLAWTALALFFARRWLAAGRWRDAFGLGTSVSLQIWASSYSLIAAAFVAPAFGIWLLLRYGVSRVRPGQAALIAVLVGTAGWFAITPYLELRATSELMEREVRFYTTWSNLLPGGIESSGAVASALAVLGLLAPPGRGRRVGDPRLAMLASLLLVALAATGGNSGARAGAVLRGAPPPLALPDVYALASSVVPLLDSVRGVYSLAIGVHLLVCMAAGFGAAFLLRRVPSRAATPVAALALAAVFASTQLAGRIGFGPPLHFEAVSIRPDPDTLAFFEKLSRLGNRGPLAEFPPVSMSFWGADAEVSRILASAWHRRRTSACFGSFQSPAVGTLRGISTRLPAREAIGDLRELGFTTLVLHGRRALRRQLRALSREADPPLRHLHSAGPISAWALEPAAGR